MSEFSDASEAWSRSREALEEEERKDYKPAGARPQIVIEVSGGCVANVWSTTELDYLVLDRDAPDEAPLTLAQDTIITPQQFRRIQGGSEK